MAKKQQPVDDEHQGQGGSYLLDPATGKRTLVERTQEAETAEISAAEQPAATDTTEG